MITKKTPLQKAENNINVALGAAGFLILMTLAMIALQLAPISGLVVVELVITTLGVWKVAANKSIPWMFVISLLIFGSEALDIAKGTYGTAYMAFFCYASIRGIIGVFQYRELNKTQRHWPGKHWPGKKRKWRCRRIHAAFLSCRRYFASVPCASAGRERSRSAAASYRRSLRAMEMLRQLPANYQHSSRMPSTLTTLAAPLGGQPIVKCFSSFPQFFASDWQFLP